MLADVTSYLLGKKAETLVLSYAFVGLAKQRVERLTSCSVVGGRISGDCKSSNNDLEENKPAITSAYKSTTGKKKTAQTHV